ncbi:MAG: hypothetical protein AAF431_17610 [Pseudomonadota bacterium]
MQSSNKGIVKRWVVPGFSILGIGVIVAVVLSSYYYRSLELNPQAVWHGANMGARSLFSDTPKSEPPVDVELVSRVGEKLLNDPDSYLQLKPINSARDLNAHLEIKNQIAVNEARERQFNQNLEKLEKARPLVLSTKSTQESLPQDYSAVEAHSAIEAARRADIEAALEMDQDVPTEEDAQALISNRSRNTSARNPIPQTVLDNVQRTTGITAEEINELLNK